MPIDHKPKGTEALSCLIGGREFTFILKSTECTEAAKWIFNLVQEGEANLFTIDARGFLTVKGKDAEFAYPLHTPKQGKSSKCRLTINDLRTEMRKWFTEKTE